MKNVNVESLAGRYAPSSDFVSNRWLEIQTDPLPGCEVPGLGASASIIMVTKFLVVLCLCVAEKQNPVLMKSVPPRGSGWVAFETRSLCNTKCEL